MNVGEASRRDNEFDSCRKLPSKDEKSSAEFVIADDLRRVCCAERCRVDGARCKVLWYVVGRSVTMHGRSTGLSSGVEVSQAGVLDTRFLVETWKDSCPVCLQSAVGGSKEGRGMGSGARSSVGENEGGRGGGGDGECEEMGCKAKCNGRTDGEQQRTVVKGRRNDGGEVWRLEEMGTKKRRPAGMMDFRQAGARQAASHLDQPQQAHRPPQGRPSLLSLRSLTFNRTGQRSQSALVHPPLIQSTPTHSSSLRHCMHPIITSHPRY